MRAGRWGARCCAALRPKVVDEAGSPAPPPTCSYQGSQPRPDHACRAAPPCRCRAAAAPVADGTAQATPEVQARLELSLETFQYRKCPEPPAEVRRLA